MTNSIMLKYFKVNHRHLNNSHLDMLVFEVSDTCSLTWSNQTLLEIIGLQKQAPTRTSWSLMGYCQDTRIQQTTPRH